MTRHNNQGARSNAREHEVARSNVREHQGARSKPGSTRAPGPMAGSRAPGSTTGTTKIGARARGGRTTGPGVDLAGIATESPTAPSYIIWRIFLYTAGRTATGQQVGPEISETETKKSRQ